MRSKSLSSRLLLSLALCAAAPPTLTVAATPAPTAAAAAPVVGRVIVRFTPEAARRQALGAGARAVPQRAAALGARHGLALRDGASIDDTTQAVSAPGLDSASLRARLLGDPDVEAVYIDHKRRALRAPNDPYFFTAPELAAGQWYLRAPDATTPAAIDAAGAWDLTIGDPAIVVAVVDTGVLPQHPDLVGKLLPGRDFVGPDSPGDFTTAGDGDGWDADPTDPGDYDAGNASSWHGTQTAGLVGAGTDNGLGMAGAGWRTPVLPVRALGRGGGYDSDIIAAMRWAAGLSLAGVPLNPNPARVINLSLGGGTDCGAYPAVLSELAARKVVVVAAAGNEGVEVLAPAKCSGAIAVAGLRHAGTKVGYSNLGPEVTIAAPAGNIGGTGSVWLYPLLTTSSDGVQAAGAYTWTDRFDPSYGTSFSAPLVSATAALMLGVQPTMSATDVRRALQLSARPFPTTSDTQPQPPACQAPTAGLVQDSECLCTTTTCGAGMLDARASVALAERGVLAVVGVSADPTAGATVRLSASGSFVLAGRTAGYAWSVRDPEGLAVAVTGANQAQASFVPSVAGRYEATLTVSDGSGSSSTTQAITVGAALPPTAGGGGGGGGALHAGWLLALAAAAVALRRTRG